MKKSEVINDLETLGFHGETAETAAAAIMAALQVGEYAPPGGMPAATAAALGALNDASDEPLSARYKRAACALEWDSAEWQTFGQLPTAGGWRCEALPKAVEKPNFVWTRVHTEGTGNGGRWVPGKCRTRAARAVFNWFKVQTSVPFYGGYWWEAIDSFGPSGLDELSNTITRYRDAGGEYPGGCAAAARIDPRLGKLSGPRMWALVEAVAPLNTWHPDPEKMAIERRRRRGEKLREEFARHGVTFIPA